MKVILVIPLVFFVGLAQAKWFKDRPTSEESEEDLPSPPRVNQASSETVQRMWWNAKSTDEARYSPQGAWWGVGKNQREGSRWFNEKTAGWWGTENTNTWWAVPTRDNYDVCRVSNNKVETISNVRYGYPATTCYTILAKDCSSEPNFQILLRQMRKESNLWELKIETQYNAVILRNTQEEEPVQIYINGAYYNSNEVSEVTENGQIVIQVIRDEQFTTVNLPAFGVQLAFDGYNVIMNFEKSGLNQLCGGVCDHRTTSNTDPNSGSAESEINEDIHKKYILRNQCIAE